MICNYEKIGKQANNGFMGTFSFSKAKTETTPVVIEGKHIETVEKTKLLGVTIQNNLRWDNHVEDMYKKASKRLYFLTLLKRAGLHSAELLKYYCFIAD